MPLPQHLLRRNSLPPARSFPSSPKARLSTAYLPRTASRQPTKLSSKLHPFASSRRFWPSTAPANKPQVDPVLPSTPSRAFTGRIFITTTGSSAPLHVSPNPLNFSSWHRAIALTRKPYRASPVITPAPRERSHPQSHAQSVRVSGFALFCTLTHHACRIRFTTVMYRSLPIASFRPRRYQQRPCDSDSLPLGRGVIAFFQATGFAGFAGQTKKRARNTANPSLLQNGRNYFA
ncbi:hypothetical protein SCARR_01842 [Pontiella sulfatireligans]|uniref:Uncharacterized protein n=1 Tax=Pontiella sulfatireligans TaxID=2750658 RepID=A0A6C2UIT0_9BACT|nr:hypothetical protein SCARR_01842 [Pontiella sulfatireligans]